ncbi:lipocalin family protein [Streptomyces griseoruber]|uniref:lipocalin family protein n=1 Tax=Streptomyces griseoruber TaxID=1943 RepID=UPI0037A8DE17
MARVRNSFVHSIATCVPVGRHLTRSHHAQDHGRGGSRRRRAHRLVLQPDGTHTLAEATLAPDRSTLWTSPHTGKKYPTRWKITIPGEHATLNVKVYANDQELTVPGPRYQGGAAVTGTYDHHPVTGTTYVELTGGQ